VQIASPHIIYYEFAKPAVGLAKDVPFLHHLHINNDFAIEFRLILKLETTSVNMVAEKAVKILLKVATPLE